MLLLCLAMTEHFKITPIEETTDSFTFQVASPGNERVIITFRPPNKVSVEVGVGESEQEVSPEYPEVTLEGRVAKDAGAFGGVKYDKEKHTFSVRIAHQYNPGNPHEADYYNIEASGEAADSAYSLYLNNKGVAVRVGGWDMSGSTKLDKGTKGLIKADFIERIQGRRPYIDIVPGRVRLGESEA